MDTKQEVDSSGHNAAIETVEDTAKLACEVGLADGKDRVAEFLGNAAQRVVVSESDNKRILRKIDFTLLPIMLGVYFLQQLDKSTLSYASVFGLLTVGFPWIGIDPSCLLNS